MASQSKRLAGSRSSEIDRFAVLAELRRRATSPAALARSHEYHVSTLTHVFERPCPIAEKIVANAIGRAPEELWQVRERLRVERRERRILKEPVCAQVGG